MSRGDFNNACSEIHFNISVGNDGNFTTDQRKNDGFSDEVLVSFVVGMNGNCCITEKCFGAGCCKVDIFVAVFNGIAKMPEMAVGLVIDNLCIRNGCKTMGAPVDYTLATIDEPLVVKADKNFTHGIRATFVESETFTLPVAGSAKFFKLLDYSATVFFLPLPCTFEELFTAEVFFREAFCLHCLNYLCFGSDRGMVCSGKPKRRLALHTLIADENVLKGFIKGMSHMELTGDVRWGYYNCVGFFICINLGVKIVSVEPKLIYSGLNLARVVNLC